MDQPVISPQPVFTQTPVSPEPSKPSFPKWPLIAIALFSFFLGIASVLAYQKYLPAGSNPAAPFPSPQASPAADWKTYTNFKYGFSVQYDFNNQPIEVESSGQQLALISFGTMKNNGFDIEITTGDSLDYYKNQLLDHVTGKIDREEKVTVDGIAGVKLTYKQVVVIDEFSVSQVIINQGNRDYIIRSLATDIDQILATFKFTDLNEIGCSTGSDCPDGYFCNTFDRVCRQALPD